jgi:hypothetical protein
MEGLFYLNYGATCPGHDCLLRKCAGEVFASQTLLLFALYMYIYVNA